MAEAPTTDAAAGEGDIGACCSDTLTASAGGREGNCGTTGFGAGAAGSGRDDATVAEVAEAEDDADVAVLSPALGAGALKTRVKEGAPELAAPAIGAGPAGGGLRIDERVPRSGTMLSGVCSAGPAVEAVVNVPMGRGKVPNRARDTAERGG